MSDALTWKELDEKGTLGDQKIEALVDALALNGMLLVSILVLALGLLVEHVLATIAGTKAK